MSDILGGLLLLFVLLLLWTCNTGRGRYEWTFDGVPHVLQLGK